MTGNYPLLRPDRKSPYRTASPLLLARKVDTGWKNSPPLLPPQRWCLLPPIKPDYASPGPPGSAFLLVRADLRRDRPWRDGPIQPRSPTTLPRCFESADLKYAMFAGLLASPSAPLCCPPGGWPRRAVRFRQRPPCRKRSVFLLFVFLRVLPAVRLPSADLVCFCTYQISASPPYLCCSNLQVSSSQTQTCPLSTQWKPQLMEGSSPTPCLTTSRVGVSGVICTPLVWRGRFTTGSTTRVALSRLTWR